MKPELDGDVIEKMSQIGLLVIKLCPFMLLDLSNWHYVYTQHGSMLIW